MVIARASSLPAVVGSLLGEFAGIQGWIKNSWIGDQGFEYLDLGRLWQVLLTVGLCFGAVIIYRGLRNRLSGERAGNLPWVFVLFGLVNSGVLRGRVACTPRPPLHQHRFLAFLGCASLGGGLSGVVHHHSSCLHFCPVGCSSRARRVEGDLLDIILYSAGGIVGSMHHVYFSGEPALHMALGTFFWAAEVIPLTFLTLEAWSFLQLGAVQGAKSKTPFPHYWAVMFLAAVGFWNFLGAGVFGFLINLPIVSYYEIGTALTAKCGQASMMGVYGMLSIGLALFCLRYIIPEKYWSEKSARTAFWSLNLGLA